MIDKQTAHMIWRSGRYTDVSFEEMWETLGLGKIPKIVSLVAKGDRVYGLDEDGNVWKENDLGHWYMATPDQFHVVPA